MDALLIEQEKAELTKFYTLTASPRKRLLYLFKYYYKILNSKNKQIKSSYLPEFIENYLKCLYHFEPIGINPSFTENILSQINLLLKEVSLNQFSDKLTEGKWKLEKRYQQLQIVLNGGIIAADKKDELYFPVIEQTIYDDDYSFGLLETFSVKINDEKHKTKFHIAPSGKEIEKRIKEQIEISWAAAVKLVKKYITRLRTNHSVFLQFDHHYGEYVGDSLGIALTLTFMSELHRFYNSKIQIKYNGRIAVTGGLDNELNISPISEKNIIQKTEIVFYSDTDVFVVNEKEKNIAQNQLEKLKKEYPNRKLKIIGVEDFIDLLDRRSILEVHKQKFIVRGARYARKNWVAVLLIILFFSAFSYLYIKDFDSNPAILDKSGKYVLIKNKSGKILWKKQFYPYVPEKNVYVGELLERIIDLGDDGINEVLMTEQVNDSKEHGILNCFNNSGVNIWKYKFKDSISTNVESFKPNYVINIAGVDTLDGEKILYLIANQHPYFPAAIFRIRAKDAKRLPGTFWHPGRITTALLNDIDNDGVKELICSATNNEWESSVVFAINKDSLYGRGPAIYKYVFPGKKLYNFINYLKIPKSDIAAYQKMRYPFISSGNFTYKEHRNLFFDAVNQSKITSIDYVFEKDLRIVDVVISDYFRVERDSLVAQAKLSPPFTDTPEYKEILKNQIRYWNGKKFVTAKGYYKNKAAR